MEAAEPDVLADAVEIVIIPLDFTTVLTKSKDLYFPLESPEYDISTLALPNPKESNKPSQEVRTLNTSKKEKILIVVFIKIKFLIVKKYVDCLSYNNYVYFLFEFSKYFLIESATSGIP